jgi:hypothetical protein
LINFTMAIIQRSHLCCCKLLAIGWLVCEKEFLVIHAPIVKAHLN